MQKSHLKERKQHRHQDMSVRPGSWALTLKWICNAIEDAAEWGRVQVEKERILRLLFLEQDAMLD